jgi:hypothetical protein
MLAEQRKSGHLGMIELRSAPLGRGVAIGAIIAALATMRIVGRMAADAAARSLLVPAPEVTGTATEILVSTVKREAGGGVIEFST